MKSIWVLNYRTNDLQSVENISSSLVDLYRALPGHEIKIIDLYDFSSHRTELEIYKKNPPAAIAVVHPSVNYHFFFLSLLVLNRDVEILFHVFGNFIRNGDLWAQQSHLLQGKKVKFLAASPAYKKVLASFIPESNLGLVPFPVQFSQEFKTAPTPETWKLIYSGRYHEQKNCTVLIEALDKLAVHNQQKIELTMMVVFDDFNPTTIQTKKRQGEQYARFINACAKTSSYLSVQFIPHGSFQEMSRQFSQHHAFISFSTFFDEDYGCAVLEALCSGLPCVLSRWGGYGDFAALFPHFCFGLDVIEENNQLVLEADLFESFVEKACTMNTEERAMNSRQARQFASSQNLSATLLKEADKIHSFQGFKKELAELAVGLKTNGNVEKFRKYYEPFWNFQGGTHAD